MSKVKKFLSFMEILFFAVFGIIPGILIGLAFGVLIAYVAGQFQLSDGENIPLALGAFLGMGVGAVIGGVFGGVIGYKK